jgi:hypothetical protein
MNFGFSILDFGLGRTIRKAFFRIESRFVNNPKSKIQNLNWMGIFAIAFTIAFGSAVAPAQRAAKVARIGFWMEALRPVWRSLGTRSVKI